MAKQTKGANVEKMYKLHDKFVDYLLEALDSGEEIPSGTLNAINSLLKNNGIFTEITDQEEIQSLNVVYAQYLRDNNLTNEED